MPTLVLAVILIVAAVESVYAATFNVDSAADSVDAIPGDGLCATSGGSCTLRAAIQETSASMASDTINLPAGTYALTIAGTGEDAAATGDLDIAPTGGLIIAGAGAGSTTIDGSGLDRVFDVKMQLCCPVRISDVTIQNGTVADAGAGIMNLSTLQLERVIIRDNHAAGPGGGVLAAISATTFISDSAIVSNTARAGGGIYHVVDSGSVTLNLFNVTISGNSATLNGGGIEHSFGHAGLNNVTITNNTADSDANGSGDGGGMAFADFPLGISLVSMGLGNSIIAGNIDSGGEAPDCLTASSTTVNSLGYNLFGNPAGCSVTGDLTGNISNAGALLEPLGNNGGDTLTHALQLGSPAFDNGNPAAPGSGGLACNATDQRGVNRPQAARCDMGAFESEILSPLPTTSPTGTPTPVPATPTSTPTVPLCGTMPAVACNAGERPLLIRRPGDPSQSKLIWKWKGMIGSPTSFGDPTAGTRYELCIYDRVASVPTLKLRISIAAGGICGSRLCWRPAGSGFQYRNTALIPHGIRKILLTRNGSQTKITIKGKGASLNLPPPAGATYFSQDAAVTVQLLNSNGACWKTDFATPAIKNNAGQFKDR